MLSAAKKSTRRGGGGGKVLGGLGVLLERNHVGVLRAQPRTDSTDPAVDLPGLAQVCMDRLLDGNHAVRPDTAVVAGDQHWPFGDRHEKGIVHLELNRDLAGTVPGVEPGLLDV